jgi:hypothetical protein
MRQVEQACLLSYVARVSDTAHVLEFGSGGSTVLMAQHLKPSQHLYSVEHAQEWYGKVHAELNGQENVHLQLREPTLDMTLEVSAEDAGVVGALTVPLSISRYTVEECSAGLNTYLNLHYGNQWEETELVLVDGMARGACLALLRHVLPSGCTVLLHDYARCEDEASRKEWYGWAVNLYQKPVDTVGSLLILRVP